MSFDAVEAPVPVDTMTGIEFEDYLQAGFERLGWKVDTTPGYSDFGGDLICYHEDEGGLKIDTLCVQAKRQTRNVGVKAVQQTLGAMGHYKTEKGLVVTNRNYTKQAIELASNNDIELWNRGDLIRLLGADGLRDDEGSSSGGDVQELPTRRTSRAPVHRDGVDEEAQLAAAREEMHRLSVILVEDAKNNKLKKEYWAVDPGKGPLTGGPYPIQVDFHNASLKNPERMLMAANRFGKTRSGGAEIAMHATGMYPPWYKGKRIPKQGFYVCGSETNESLREIVQKELFGEEGRGTGWLPKDSLHTVKARSASGVSDVVDYCLIRHKGGGLSKILFKTYEQGRTKWQGFSADAMWFDEEPPIDIYNEGQLRLLDRQGIVFTTFTPLLGMTEAVMHFIDGGDGIWYVSATWDDARHLDAATKIRLLKSLPPHERLARSEGVPMAGTGLVYPTRDDHLSVEPYSIPMHWPRICGIDFGMDHPFAAVWLAWDRDADSIVLYDCYSAANEVAAYHSAAINARGRFIPVSWPADGMQRGKNDGIQLKEHFKNLGVNVLPQSARYKDGKKNGGMMSKEPIVQEIDQMMRTGRFKVFSTLLGWFREKRMYHRDDGQIVAVNDDLMSATHYAVMMRRWAKLPESTNGQNSSLVGYSPFGMKPPSRSFNYGKSLLVTQRASPGESPGSERPFGAGASTQKADRRPEAGFEPNKYSGGSIGSY